MLTSRASPNLTAFLASLSVHDAGSIPDGLGAYGNYDPPRQPGRPLPDDHAMLESTADRIHRELREGAEAEDWTYCAVCGEPAVTLKSKKPLCAWCAPFDLLGKPMRPHPASVRPIHTVALPPGWHVCGRCGSMPPGKCRVCHAKREREYQSRFKMRTGVTPKVAQLRKRQSVVSDLAPIVAAVSTYYGVTEKDLIGDSRYRSVAIARMVTMYLGRELTKCSMEQIGDVLGGRDHSTVHHGIGRIGRMTQTDEALRVQVETIREWAIEMKSS